MIDTATNWFYGERRLSAGAAIENLRHELWAWGYYNVWLRLVRSELPYLAGGLYNGEKFELEFEPRQYVIIRAAKENEWLLKGFTRVLGMGRLASLTAAIIYQLSGFYIVSVVFTMIIAAAACWPVANTSW